MVAQGDFDQRVDFMGEFSAAFNSMVANLKEARETLQQHEAELAQVNASLVQEITDRTQAEALLNERIVFETLLSDLSARFVHLPIQEMDEAIRQGLQMIVEFLDVDRGSLVEFPDNPTRAQAVYAYVRPDIPQAPIVRASSQWPWWNKQIRQGNIIAVERIDDLPAEAAVEREAAWAIGLKSYLAIPLAVGNVLIGYMAFPSYHRERAWPQELLPRLKLIGGIFANAIARNQVEKALRERVLFETLISDLSATFIHLPAQQVDQALQQGLESIVQFLDVDRGTLVELAEDQNQSVLISSHARPGIPPAPAGAATGEWQVWNERIRRAEIIAVERLDDLPAEATRERELNSAIGLKSYLAIPLAVGRVTLGFIAFLSFRREHAWPQELLPRLRLIGEIFANAIARKRAEEELHQSYAELQMRNEELDAFAHTVAHDLKNPVSLMSLSTDMLLSDEFHPNDTEAREIALTISHAAHKMDSIIQELLLLAQVRKSEVQTQPLDMDSIVQEACQQLARMSAEHKAEITRPAASEWPIALGYGPWIEEVWANYIGNAIKYGGQPPRVELGAELLPPLPSPPQAGRPPLTSPAQERRRVRFWVRDNGAGLAPEAQARLFAPFERLGQVRVSGYGLGLSIVKRIVEKLGGQVGVESQVGQGTTFYFTLPAVPPIDA